MAEHMSSMMCSEVSNKKLENIDVNDMLAYVYGATGVGTKNSSINQSMRGTNWFGSLRLEMRNSLGKKYSNGSKMKCVANVCKIAYL